MRTAEVKRETKETKISLFLNIDGKGNLNGTTGIAFLDHMLTLFCTHGFFDLNLEVKGDLEVDAHHTTEDLGLCLGIALKKALGDKKGINRFGQAAIPMDEALAQVFIDLSGRPFFFYKGKSLSGQVGQFDLELVKEFFRAMSNEAKMNLHIHLLYGENKHHCIEAIFKAFARALKEAVSLFHPDIIPSSKGVL